MNDAHGSDHLFRPATSVRHRHKSDQRLRLTLPSHSQHIFKALTRTHPRTTTIKLRFGTTNRPRKLTVLKTQATHPGNASEILATAPKPDATRVDVVRKSATRLSRVATIVTVAGSRAKAMDPSQSATRDRTQAVELIIIHCSPKCKPAISHNNLQRLKDPMVIGMIIGAKSRQRQRRMIPYTDSLHRAPMNTDVLIAAKYSATHHGNIESRTGHTHHMLYLQSNTTNQSHQSRTLIIDPHTKPGDIINHTLRCTAQQPL